MEGGNPTSNQLFAGLPSFTTLTTFSPLTRNPQPQPQPTNFTDLPFEIRTQIYKLAVPLSRVLRMRLTQAYNPPVIESISPPCVPTILHINRESRAIGLTIFQTAFGPSSGGCVDEVELSKREKRRMTYWNPKIDTLYLPFFNPPSDHDLRQPKDLLYPDHRYYDNDGEDYDDSKLGAPIYHRYSLVQHVRHLALPVNRESCSGFSVRREVNQQPDQAGFFYDEDGERKLCIPAWLNGPGFENLETLTMLDDPMPGWYRAGEICLHEPVDEVAENFGRREQGYINGMEHYVKEEGWKGKAGEEGPWVEMLIMTHRKVRANPAFCVRPKKVLDFAARMAALNDGGVRRFAWDTKKV